MSAEHSEELADLVEQCRHALGRTFPALGQLADPPSAATDWYRKARAMLAAAVQLLPENHLYRQAQKELEALSPPKP